MASTYSDRLRIELIGTGDQSGTWGITTNTNLGTIIEEAIAGLASITMTDANYTLSVVDGGTDEARQMMIWLSGTLSATRDVICPAEEKLYFVKNGTSGGQSIVFKTSAGTGVTIPNGQTSVVICDGTNVVDGFTYIPALGSAWIKNTGAGDTSFNGSQNGLALTATSMDTTNKYTPSIKFGSTDTAFTTTNPKFGAAIVGVATESYAANTDGGMALSFWTSPDNPGTGSGLTEVMRLNQFGTLGLGTVGAQHVVQYISTDMKTTASGSSSGYGVYVNSGVDASLAALTGSANGIYFQSVGNTEPNGGTPYTVANLIHYQATSSAFDVDSTVDAQYGFNVSSAVDGATRNYGYTSGIAGFSSYTNTSVVRATNTTTVTTSTNHNLVSGDTVVVAGVTPSSFNGIYTVLSAATNTFTYTQSGLPDVTATVVGTSTKSNNLAFYAVGTAPSQFNGPVSILANSGMEGLRVRQSGTGPALVVEDALIDLTPLIVTADGRVGIQTSDPSSGYVLTVNGLTNIAGNADVTPDANWSGQLTIGGNGYSGGLALDATGVWIGGNSASRGIVFATNETERAYIDGSGDFFFNRAGAARDFNIAGDTLSSLFHTDGTNDRVGIGTGSPTVRFEAVHNNPTRGVIAQLNNTGTSGLTGSQLTFLQNTVNWWTIGQPAATDAFSIWRGRYSGADGTVLFHIDSDGDVGIGTNNTSPAAKLDVLGPASVTSFTGTTRLGVAVRGSTGATDYSGIDLIGNSGSNPTARIAVLSTGGGSYLSLGTSSSYASGVTNRAITIDPEGNTLIGNYVDPVNVLQVNGYSGLAPGSVPAAGSTGHAIAWGANTYGIASGTLSSGVSYIQGTRWDGTATNYNILLQPNGGFVGIGVPAPAAKFHVAGTGADYLGYFQNTGTTASNDCYVGILTNSTGTTATTSGIAFGDADNTAIGSIRYIHSSDSMSFYTNGSTARMTIDSAGRLYTNTGSDITPNTSWDGQLTIQGNAYVGGLSLNASGIWIGTNSADRGIIFAVNETEIGRVNSSGNLFIGGSGGSNAGRIAATSSGGNVSHGVYGVVDTKTSSGFYGVYGVSNVTSTYASGGVFGISINSNTYGISGYWTGAAYYSFYGNGNSFTSGTWQTSDARLKENVETLSNSLSIIDSLRPVSFDWKENSDAARNGNHHDYGLIAQEVLPILPDIVREITAPDPVNKDNPSLNEQLKDFYTIEYSRLVPHLIAAVKELKGELDAIKAELSALKGQ